MQLNVSLSLFFILFLFACLSAFFTHLLFRFLD